VRSGAVPCVKETTDPLRVERSSRGRRPRRSARACPAGPSYPPRRWRRRKAIQPSSETVTEFVELAEVRGTRTGRSASVIRSFCPFEKSRADPFGMGGGGERGRGDVEAVHGLHGVLVRERSARRERDERGGERNGWLPHPRMLDAPRGGNPTGSVPDAARRSVVHRQRPEEACRQSECQQRSGRGTGSAHVAARCSAFIAAGCRVVKGVQCRHGPPRSILCRSTNFGRCWRRSRLRPRDGGRALERPSRRCAHDQDHVRPDRALRPGSRSLPRDARSAARAANP